MKDLAVGSILRNDLNSIRYALRSAPLPKLCFKCALYAISTSVGAYSVFIQIVIGAREHQDWELTMNHRRILGTMHL